MAKKSPELMEPESTETAAKDQDSILQQQAEEIARLKKALEISRNEAEIAKLETEKVKAEFGNYNPDSDKKAVMDAIAKAEKDGVDPWNAKVRVRAALRSDTNDKTYWLGVNGRYCAVPADDKYHELKLPFAEALVNSINAAKFVREYADKNIQVYDPVTNPHPVD